MVYDPHRVVVTNEDIIERACKTAVTNFLGGQFGCFGGGDQVRADCECPEVSSDMCTNADCRSEDRE